MTTIDSSRLLLQLRALAAEAGAKAPEAAAAPGMAPADFGKALRQSLERVNEMQGSASALAVAFEQGQAGVDLTRVMLESQKASLAFRATSEIRNRLVNAYREVMNMPI